MYVLFLIQIERPLDRLSSQEPKDFKHDAFLFCDDESHEIKTEIYNDLEKRGIKLYTEEARGGQGAISDLDYVIKNCYWTIAILTKKALQDRAFNFQLLSLLESFLEDKNIRLIPVLVDTGYGDIPDAIRFVTYVGVDENKRYLERLHCTLKGTLFNLRFCVIVGHLNYSNYRINRSWETYIKCSV